MAADSTDVIPLLACSAIEAEHDFLVSVLGFASAGIERTPDGSVVHAEVRAGQRRIWLHRSDESSGVVPPAARGSAGGGIVVHVPDVDAHHEDGLRSPEGGLWWVATPTKAPAARAP